MKKLILLLTFVSALAYGASGTIELGPTIGGGGAAGVSSLNSLTGDLNLVQGSGITITPSGTNITISSAGGGGLLQDLSNLTSPTAANQSILFGTDASFDIGAASGASRPNNIYSAVSVSAGYYPLAGGHTGIALINGASPAVGFYDGGSDAYRLEADSNIGGLSFVNPGSGVTIMNLRNNGAAFDMIGTVTLPRITTVQRDALTAANGMEIYNSDTDTFQGYQAGAWIDIAGGSSGANITLSNLDMTTAINSSLQFNADGTYNIGASGAAVGQITAYTYNDQSGNARLSGQYLYANGVVRTIDLDGGWLFATDGSTKTFNYKSSQANDQSGVLSSDFGARVLYDHTGTLEVFNYDARELEYPGQDLALDFSVDLQLGMTGQLYSSYDGVGGPHPPVVSSCGTSPLLDGTDSAGVITLGSGVFTSCTLTFNQTWVAAPHCFANNQGAVAIVRATPTTTAVVFDAVALVAGAKLDYFCIGNK